MSLNKQFDVIVVGAGMVGLAGAIALGQFGLKVAVIEAKAHPEKLPLSTEPYDARVVALNRSSEKFLSRLGVWSTIINTRSLAYQHMKIWDNALDGLITFSASDFFEPNLGYMVEQKVILGALFQAAEALDITFFWGAKIEALQYLQKYNELTLQENTILQAPLVIGVDGANSALRKLCQISSKRWDYHQTAIVATVEGAKSHSLTAFQRFSSDGSLALLPLQTQNISSIVWATSRERALELNQIEKENFENILAREIDHVMGEMTLIGERYLFPLSTHHANRYSFNRCVLAGDAAHTLHPLAGQGVNLGFLDMASLVNHIEQAKNKKRDLGCSKMLNRYERQRRGHNQTMIWSMELFKRGFISQSNFIQWIRNTGLNWVHKTPAVKQMFAEMALGTSGPWKYEY